LLASAAYDGSTATLAEDEANVVPVLIPVAKPWVAPGVKPTAGYAYATTFPDTAIQVEGAIRSSNLSNQNRLRPPVFALWFCIVGISSSLESPLPEMAEDLSHTRTTKPALFGLNSVVSP
jgi:hypothetical protein